MLDLGDLFKYRILMGYMIEYTFLISMPCWIAKFRVITITEGTANPSAHGHDATNIDMALSKGKHHTQYWSMTTFSIAMRVHQMMRTSSDTKRTPLTK
jgi:hypothetical protein